MAKRQQKQVDYNRYSAHCIIHKI